MRAEVKRSLATSLEENAVVYQAMANSEGVQPERKTSTPASRADDITHSADVPFYNVGNRMHCANCGAELEEVRPGKWQCPECG